MTAERNYEKYFGDPAKAASCIIEHDLEEEIASGCDECLHLYSASSSGEVVDVGLFYGSWQLEEFLCSDLPYEVWRKSRQ